MNVIAMWLRVDLRQRARSLVALALIIALASATVLTAFAGARRAQTTIARLEARTQPATSAVLANTPGFDWTRVERLPEVAALTRFVVDYSIQVKDLPSDVLSFPPADDNAGRTIERPVIYAGRMFDPRRADEVVVTRQFVSRYHRGVGGHVALRLPTTTELYEDSLPSVHGPSIDARIVGVIGSPWFSDGPGSPGSVVLSPGIVSHYPAETIGNQKDPANTNYINTLVRLHGGEAAIPQFRRDLARVTGRSDLDVWDLPDQARQIQRDITFESWCLVVFGLIALAAALFLAGQAIARFVEAEIEDLRTVQALGLTRMEALVNAAVGPTIAGIVGAVLGVIAAYFASTWFPIGTAGLLEPSPGRSMDWLVLGVGAVVTVLVVAACVVWSAHRALVASRARPRQSLVDDMATRANWPVPVLIGSRFALEPGRGRNAVPVRPAIVGAVIGVLGITAAFTFSYAVHDAASHPQRFGQTYQAGAFLGLNGTDYGPVPKVMDALAHIDDVTGLLRARSAVVGNPSGTASVTIYTYNRERKALPVVMTSGRLPASSEEIALAPTSVAALHTAVGRTVTLEGTNGSHRYRVTGEGFVPSGAHNGYADGGWTTPAGFDRVAKTFKFDVVLVATRSTADPKATAAALTAQVVKADPSLKGLEISPPDPLQEIAEIRNVQVLPAVLGAFVALLALGAIGHALATAVRRRSRDLAVLRAMGMTPRQCRMVVVVQSTLLGLLGLVFGVPIGLVIGRLVWSAVASYTPLQYVAPFAGWELILVAPAALVAANLLGVWPSHRAARLRVAEVLRAE